MLRVPDGGESFVYKLFVSGVLRKTFVIDFIGFFVDINRYIVKIGALLLREEF